VYERENDAKQKDDVAYAIYHPRAPPPLLDWSITHRVVYYRRLCRQAFNKTRNVEFNGLPKYAARITALARYIWGFQYMRLSIYAFSIRTVEIGLGLSGFGIAFLFLGVLLLFDKGLLAVGNVSSLIFIFRFNYYMFLHLSTFFCVFSCDFCLFQRVFIAINRWCVVAVHCRLGACCGTGTNRSVLLSDAKIARICGVFRRHRRRTYRLADDWDGFYVLFSGFLPVVAGFLQQMPFVGAVLRLPLISRLVAALTRGSGKNQV
jgi:hypothetical protein